MLKIKEDNFRSCEDLAKASTSNYISGGSLSLSALANVLVIIFFGVGESGGRFATCLVYIGCYFCFSFSICCCLAHYKEESFVLLFFVRSTLGKLPNYNSWLAI